MSLYTNPYGKQRRVTMGLRDDSITPPEEAQRAVGAAGIIKQTGSVKSLTRDQGRKALPPGKRVSRSGNIYWENRRSRSDLPGSNL